MLRGVLGCERLSKHAEIDQTSPFDADLRSVTLRVPMWQICDLLNLRFSEKRCGVHVSLGARGVRK
jgi:hypothetical protein